MKNLTKEEIDLLIMDLVEKINIDNLYRRARGSGKEMKKIFKVEDMRLEILKKLKKI